MKYRHATALKVILEIAKAGLANPNKSMGKALEDIEAVLFQTPIHDEEPKHVTNNYDGGRRSIPVGSSKA